MCVRAKQWVSACRVRGRSRRSVEEFVIDSRSLRKQESTSTNSSLKLNRTGIVPAVMARTRAVGMEKVYGKQSLCDRACMRARCADAALDGIVRFTGSSPFRGEVASSPTAALQSVYDQLHDYKHARHHGADAIDVLGACAEFFQRRYLVDRDVVRCELYNTRPSVAD